MWNTKMSVVVHEPIWPPWTSITPGSLAVVNKTGIAPFDRLVDQVMTQPSYAEARRVFWIVDNGSSHRGQTSIDRLKAKYSKRFSLTRCRPEPFAWFSALL